MMRSAAASNARSNAKSRTRRWSASSSPGIVIRRCHRDAGARIGYRALMLLRGRMLLDAAQPPAPGWLTIEDGRIHEIGTGKTPEKTVAGDADTLICPGFIDAHLHFPQIDCIGYDGLDLLDWLERVIYPAEMRWEDEDVAGKQIRATYER